MLEPCKVSYEINQTNTVSHICMDKKNCLKPEVSQSNVNQPSFVSVVSQSTSPGQITSSIKLFLFHVKSMLSMISEYSMFLSQQEVDKLVDHDGKCALGYHGSSNQVQSSAVVGQSVHFIKY